MSTRSFVLKETLTVAIGQAIGVGLMIAVFALVGKFSMSVVWGGLAGGILATLNFLVMAIAAGVAADKAEKQEVAAGQKIVQLSYIGRMVGMFVVLFICARTQVFHLLALVIPLVFTRPILGISEIFNRKAAAENEHEC